VADVPVEVLEAVASKRRRRSDGERSRGAILGEATRLATVEGIEGLSIGRLADAVGMSKSGVYAHFGSKQELQLATVEAAASLFAGQVIEPAGDAATALGCLRVLVEGYLAYLEAETFPGGCFFASALCEMDMQPGLVRDRLVALNENWRARLESAVRDAQREGAIDPAEDATQLAFELEAVLLLANVHYVVDRAPGPVERARRAIDDRLARTFRAARE
jgi:AcrR family transcriptional regulator